MAYEKRVCVLKQTKKGFSADGSALSGAVYAERLGDVLTITPRVLGIAPVKDGKYGLVIWAGGRSFCLELRANETLKIDGAPSLGDGFAALVCFLKGEPEPVAYGFCGKAPSTPNALLEVLRDECAGGKKSKRVTPVPKPPQELPPTGPNTPLAPGIPVPNGAPDFTGEEREESAVPFQERACAHYDDEAIAAADYFAVEADENENAAAGGEKKDKKKKNGRAAGKDGGAVHPLEFPRGSLTYYHEMKERLDKAFEKFPKDERLKTVFPQSEWVSSEGAMLGIVYREGTPRYLCVAVEANGDAPENIKEHAVFIPESYFNEGKGFYVVFQDADTGEYVHVSAS